MRSTFLLVTGILFSIASSAQVYDGFFEPQKKQNNLPQKFVWVEGQSLALKETEVTIGEYLFFLKQIYADSSEQYTSQFIPAAPCQLAAFAKPMAENNEIPWFDQIGFNKAYKYNEKEDYPIYNYPITGLTYEQASGYARWYSAYLNDYMATARGLNTKYNFRLPSPAEFEKYSQQGMTICYEKMKPELKAKFLRELQACKNEKKCALCNYAKKDTCESNLKMMGLFGNEVYPTSIFFPDCLGLFDMKGNVAEMTAEKGVAKGGSYLQPASECMPQSVQQYDAPQKWLGFRIIVDVKKEPLHD